jgi:anti-sigma factor RsiW
VKPLDHFHPADDRLIALYFGDLEADAEERRAVRQHLHGCEACTWRYTELTAPLQRLRQDAASEADEVFTPSRLAAQRAHILRRLETDAHATRVIPFPSQPVRIDRSIATRPMGRWVAAAAAAVFLIGVAAGRLLDQSSPTRSSRPTAISAVGMSSISAPAGALALDATAPTDDAFLSELDQAVDRQRIAALSVLDEMTPHVREVAVVARASR